jgi:photosystem II stability/assembly factor-like uncharacterized protein
MTDELLERVRAIDPLPDGSTAPPFESVFARVANDALQDGRHHGRPGRRRRRHLLGLLVPAVSVAVAIGVLVTAVTLLRAGPHAGNAHRAAAHGHSQSATSPTQSPTTSARIPPVPTGGMPGFVTVWGAGFNAAGNGVISLEQCLQCRANGNETANSQFHDWLVTTTNAGRSWNVSAEGYYVQRPRFDGLNGWAGGLQMLSRQQAAGQPAEWEPGEGVARYFVTHDAGRTWSVAPSAAPNEGGSSVSLTLIDAVTDNEAWAIGLGSQVTVLHAAATAGRLTATPTQPIRNDDTNVAVAGAGPGTAYLLDATASGQGFVTHDNGRIWQRLTPPPCTGRYAYADLDAAFGQTVWLTCVGGNARTPELVRSLDGGHSWQKLPIDWGRGGPQQLAAVNARVAWALSGNGELMRTTDAGATWQPVWSAADARVSPLSRPITKVTPSPLPILSVQSAESASIVTLLNRSTTGRATKLTNLVAYRTTNGGQTWKTEPVPLGSR